MDFLKNINTEINEYGLILEDIERKSNILEEQIIGNFNLFELFNDTRTSPHGYEGGIDAPELSAGVQQTSPAVEYLGKDKQRGATSKQTNRQLHFFVDANSKLTDVKSVKPDINSGYTLVPEDEVIKIKKMVGIQMKRPDLAKKLNYGNVWKNRSDIKFNF